MFHFLMFQIMEMVFNFSIIILIKAQTLYRKLCITNSDLVNYRFQLKYLVNSDPLFNSRFFDGGDRLMSKPFEKL